MVAVVGKCSKCEIITNRKGEPRPGLKCSDCSKEFCFSCAELAQELCRMMRDHGKSFWKCSECEAKGKNLQTALDTIHKELNTIKKGQNEQQTERERVMAELDGIKKGQEEQQEERKKVLEGLQKIDDIAQRVGKVEETQADNKARLDAQEEILKKATEKVEQTTKKTAELEDRLDKLDGDQLSIRQTNAVVKEIREIEKREKNLVFANIPESKATETDERIEHDEEKVKEILAELKIDDLKPRKVIRVGHEGRYARKVLAIFKSTEECERIAKAAEEVTLANDVFIARDRTYNQRQEARMYRLEREREENKGVAPQRGRGTGRGGRGGRTRGRNRGSMRGRPSMSASGSRAGSRKRQNSDEEGNAKRRKTGNEPELSGQGGSGSQMSQGEITPTQVSSGTKGQPGTPLAIMLPLSSTEGGQVF